MKDWKTYAIIILAAWCAVLTFKNKNTVLPTEEKNAASESYARKCAIATALKVYGPSKDKNKERICYFNKAVDDYGAEIDAVLTLTKGERDGIIKDASEKRKAAIEKMKARRVIGGLSTNSLNRPIFPRPSIEKESERKAREAER